MILEFDALRWLHFWTQGITTSICFSPGMVTELLGDVASSWGKPEQVADYRITQKVYV